MADAVSCSIITVTFNNLAGLRSTLDSVEAQEAQGLESIVIDGGSTDGSREFLEARASRHEFRFRSEPDDGIYHAMNKGAAMAAGELIIFMNAGDRFASPGVVGRVVADYCKRSWQWAYGCGRTLGPDGKPTSVLAFVPFRRDRLALGFATIPHQAVFMRREFFTQDLGGFDLAVGLSADQELLYRAAELSDPWLWAEFIVDFEGGGVGSQRHHLAHVQDMTRARRVKNRPLYESAHKDRLMSMAAYLSHGFRHWQSRARKKYGLYR